MTSATEIFMQGAKAREAVLAYRRDLNSTSGLTVNHGSIPCPICRTRELVWDVFPNGDIRMACQDLNCVQWIE